MIFLKRIRYYALCFELIDCIQQFFLGERASIAGQVLIFPRQRHFFPTISPPDSLGFMYMILRRWSFILFFALGWWT